MPRTRETLTYGAKLCTGSADADGIDSNFKQPKRDRAREFAESVSL
jgi:hypothetical protein